MWRPPLSALLIDIHDPKRLGLTDRGNDVAGHPAQRRPVAARRDERTELGAAAEAASTTSLLAAALLSAATSTLTLIG